MYRPSAPGLAMQGPGGVSSVAYTGEYAMVLFDFRSGRRARGGFRPATSAEELAVRARLVPGDGQIHFTMKQGPARRVAYGLVC